ncbi:MAG: nucleotidyltransferase [Ignavibacteriaceae bacterium]|nr:nucleotidyltransferase [Ignavibacteriaceae bacterium]
MLNNNELVLNENLQNLVDELDLPESKYELAVKRYETIGEYLGNDKSSLSAFNPKIYSQGSFRLGTIVKPYKSDEYDIDLVCELELEKNIGQKKLYDLLGTRLQENEQYRKILESKRRCWRLEYANEFHMDILPAIPDLAEDNNSILIPDNELKTWHHSNPKDYVDWFYQQMLPVREALIKEARAEIEKVPFYKYKTPLQRVIQILKRHRDILFEKDLDDKPVSIIITTLASKAYRNEPNLYEALLNIIDRIPNQFDSLNGQVAVLNPVNSKENFADKWDKYPERKTKFLNWIHGLSCSLSEVLKLNKKELYIEKMGTLFGTDTFSKIASKQDKMLQEHFGVTKVSPLIIIEPSKPWEN